MSNADLLQFHAFCLTTTGTRLDQYARAIAAVVRPGDVVLDLGTGAGLLALLACRAGAAHVYAVESSEAIRLGEMLAAAHGESGRIEFIQSLSTALTLPRRVDVVVADIHDTFGLQAGGVQTFIDARNRLLAPGGTLIPRATRLFVAPVEAAMAYARDIDVWSARVLGVDLSPLRPLAVDQVHATRFERDNLLADPAPVAVIDLTSTSRLLIEGTATVVAERDGLLHGLCGCFVTTLADGIEMSNVPGNSDTTNFAQAFFPLGAPQRVERGDSIAMSVQSRDGHATRWRVELSRPGQPTHAQFEHSSFEALPLTMASLRKEAGHDRG